MKLTNWGRYPQIKSTLHTPHHPVELRAIIAQQNPLIARGNGRCYGDSALQAHVTSTLLFRKLQSFDQKTGVIRVQAGLLLNELLQTIVPAGWFLPVVPGTKMITIGGAIASNVHGKNHHQAGAFGAYVHSLELMNEQGETIRCSPVERAELFANTIGGLGSTGIILSAELQLRKVETSYYQQQSLRANNLQQLLGLFTEHREEPFLVAWLTGLTSAKALGRGILHVGNNCTATDLPVNLAAQPFALHTQTAVTVPKLPFSWCINPISLWLNNTLYYWQHRQPVVKTVHYNQFYFPLDILHNWSRLYGPAGLLQYQFVVPFETADQCLHLALETIRRAGVTPYLMVLKRMGKKSTLAAATDFPMPGYSLAVDFKNTAAVHKLLHQLDELVIDHSGRVYLTKDARLPAAAFAQMYPHARKIPGRFRSLQAERIYDL